MQGLTPTPSNIISQSRHPTRNPIFLDFPALYGSLASIIMRITTLIITALSLGCILPANAQQNIIPKPASVKSFNDQGAYVINDKSCIYLVSPSKELIAQGKFLRQMLSKGTGCPLPLKKGKLIDAPENAIVLHIIKQSKKANQEAYKLISNDSQLQIKAPTSKGIFYGTMSLVQSLPLDFHKDGEKKAIKWQVGEAAFTITDAPRFGWRGIMLDEARHFFGVDAVKQILDQMALLKLNVFHWSLTNDAGWRIEIKKYPRLTSIGSKRKESEIGTWKSGRSDGKPHKGFYTQEQIRDIVKYAAHRQITIVPEFNIPGHSGAAATCYPHLSLKSPKEMPTTFIVNIALDPTKESTYKFVSDVLDEYIELFPSPIIHFGGDEVRYKEQWAGEPAIEKFMKKKGMKNLGDVQMYFSNRVSKMISKKGRRAMGWNEIYGHDVNHDGGGTASEKLDKNAIIHLWKGDWGLARHAIKEGYNLVNGYSMYTYLDYSYSSVPLDKAYSFDPVDSIGGLSEKERKQVLGVQAQMWTEWTPTLDRMQFQAFPRSVAYAEVGWTQPELKNYKDFGARLQTYNKIMDAHGIKHNADAHVAFSRTDYDKSPKLGNWNPESFSGSAISYDATPYMNLKGDYSIAFFYDKGEDGGVIKGVALYENGKIISQDKHEAFSGHEKRNIDYKLKLPALKSGASYSIKVIYEKKPSRDSHGSIYIKAPEVL